MDMIDLTKDLADLTELAGRPGRRLEDLLIRALDSLKALVPYDMAAVLELENGRLKVLSARGRLANDKVRAHSIALEDFPSVRLALETREARVLLEHDHADGEGDPYDGVLDLPHGHSCMVVPLFAGDQTLGALTFDRTECCPYPDNTLQIAGIYGHIVALAISEAKQAALLNRYRKQLEERYRILQEELVGPNPAGELLSQSLSGEMVQIVSQGQQVAPTNVPVLITGETGTGKEILAAAIHDWSPRSKHPFIKINCAALPENLIESELFGHVKGAFSGAEKKRHGRFAVANGGTLLLDEIGELPVSSQAKLLRVLQEGTYEAVGSDQSIKVDVRIIASTHLDLEQAIEDGRFREDLYYRLNVFPLELPPLRERLEDLPLLSQNILKSLAQKTGRGPWTLSPSSMEKLSRHSWSGNIRELINVLERATILCPHGALDLDIPGRRAGRKKSSEAPVKVQADGWPSLADLERRYIRQVLDKTKGKIYGAGGAGEVLGLKPSTLQSRMKKLGLSRLI
jgi:transcriptional regulator with GAF, ATPase, and Fis domain